VLRPQQYVSEVTAIDLERLVAGGIRGLLVDIDNTLVARNTREVPSSVRDWVRSAGMAGFGVCLISNNWHDHVRDFAADLGVPIVAKALKPLPFGFIRAARVLGLRPRACAVIGDQMFTDVLGGNLVGAHTVLVRPVSASDLPHTLVLRRIERLIMAGREPTS
jgi:hypothetical protein